MSGLVAKKSSDETSAAPQPALHLSSCPSAAGRGRSGEPNASPPDARCGPSMGLRSLEVLLALALQAPLADPHRRIRIGLPLAAMDGVLTLAVLRGFES